MLKWEKPMLLEVSGLGEGLGQCEVGTTPLLDRCGFGDFTSGFDHGCFDGGIAGRIGGCVAGGDASFDGPCAAGGSPRVVS